MSDEYVPHEDELPNDPNAPHGENTEDEMNVVEEPGDDD